MTLQKLCQVIALPQEVSAAVAKESIDSALIQGLLNMETAPETYAALQKQLGEDPKGYKMLAAQLNAALHTWETYAQKGIGEDIFAATMGSFSRFVQEHLASYGHYGFDRGWWTFHHLACALFRLGALEFEMKEQKLSVHIPSDAVMTRPALEASYAWAKNFFSRLGFAYEEMYCNTWLLSPALRDMLPAGSKILNFQADYEIRSQTPDAQDFMRWVFKKPYEDINALPEDTSLQRTIKKHLRQGGKIGNAYGVYVT